MCKAFVGKQWEDDYKIFGSVYVSEKLPTYPSPNLTLTLTSRFEQNVRFGEE